MIANKSNAVSGRQPWLLLLGLSQILLLGALGCRTTADNQIDLLERELRVQENYIYELEDYVVEYSDKLRSCRSCPPPQMAVYSEDLYVPETVTTPNRTKRSKKSSRRQAEKEKSVLESADEPKLEFEPDDLPDSPSRESLPEVSPENVSPEDIDVPDTLDFDLGEPVSELEDARPLQQVTEAGVLLIPDPIDFESSSNAGGTPDDEQYVEDLFADEEVEAAIAVVEQRVAERLEVAQLFRGEGDDLSPQNGSSLRNGSPQNLLAVVEALDANDEPVDLDGEVSLMVMTTAESIEGAKPKRLKRWNFTAEETVAAWQSSDLGDGLHLELPLEKIELPEAPLELWVRLVTPEGRKLLTQLPFEPSQLSDLSENQTQALPNGLVRVELEAETSDATVDSVRYEPERIIKSSESKLAANQQEAKQEAAVPQSDDQPRWRSSMQSTDRTAGSFATTSSKATGWITQAPGRQPTTPARVASSSVTSKRVANTRIHSTQQVQPKTPAKPVWTSGRTVLTR